MGLQHCSDADRRIIRECLAAAVEGPFFPEWEFHTLFGLQRGEVARVLQAWPQTSERDPDTDLAVKNAIGNLLGYPHGVKLAKYVSASEAELDELLERWERAEAD